MDNIENDILIYQRWLLMNQEQIDYFKGYYQRHRENQKERTLTTEIIGGLENESREYRKEIARFKTSIKSL